jgi:choline dehydrogenase-like flavoprotein
MDSLITTLLPLIIGSAVVPMQVLITVLLLRSSGCEPRWLPAGSAHLVGSTRMGTVDATSVTDPFGRVRGTDNLYVASNGVIPTRMAVNPTPTLLTLAARTADRIAS